MVSKWLTTCVPGLLVIIGWAARREGGVLPTAHARTHARTHSHLEKAAP